MKNNTHAIYADQQFAPALLLCAEGGLESWCNGLHITGWISGRFYRIGSIGIVMPQVQCWVDVRKSDTKIRV